MVNLGNVGRGIGGYSGLVRNLGFIIDQALSSASNFVVSLLVARTLGLAQFGYFALGMSIWVVIVALYRMTVLHPVIIDLGAGSCSPTLARGRALRIGLMLGALMAALFGGLALALDGGIVGVFAGLAVAITPVLLFEGLRAISLSLSESWRAVASDSLWMLIALCGLTIMVLAHTLTLWSAVVAWGLGAGIGMLPLLGRGRIQLSRVGAMQWMRSRAKVSSYFGLASALSSTGSQAMVWGLAAVVSPSAVGALRAAQTLMVPGRMIATSFENLFLRKLAKGGIGNSATRRGFAAVGFGSTLVWSVVFLIAHLAGYPPLATVFGDSFASYEAVLFPIVLGGLVGTLTVAELLSLRAMLAARPVCFLSGLFAASTVCFALLGAHLGGVLGATYGLFLAEAGMFSAAYIARRRKEDRLSERSDRRVGSATVSLSATALSD